ncbi:MAG: enoyl-[acyl-carrier-protein] reductase FabV, partial [Tenericutes bacterium HGW-Tenericutes-3]
FEVMMKHHVHETILEHKFRLFKDMIYGNKRIVDEKNRIRLDHLEMDPKIQKETIALMTSSDDDTFFELEGTKRFLKEVHQIHGFEFDDIDYDQDVDLEKLSEKAPV